MKITKAKLKQIINEEISMQEMQGGVDEDLLDEILMIAMNDGTNINKPDAAWRASETWLKLKVRELKQKAYDKDQIAALEEAIVERRQASKDDHAANQLEEEDE